MNPRLRSMRVIVGLMAIAGTTYLLATRQPPDITMAELRDAGAVSQRFDRWVACGPEKLAPRTRTKLQRNGYGSYRVGTIHRVCRVVWEYVDDAPVRLDGGLGGLCDGPAEVALDGGWCRTHTALPPGLVVELLRDAGEFDPDAGDEEDDTDEAAAVRLDDHYRVECDNADGGLNELRLLADGGFRHRRADGGEVPWCNAGARTGRVTPPCVIPDCWTLPDGGWNDDGPEVACYGTGPFGTMDGGPRWRGCNTTPATYATGAACIPVECSVVAGDNPIDVLR